MEWLGDKLTSALTWCQKLLFTNIEWGANKLTAMVIVYYAVIILIIYAAGAIISRLWHIWRRHIAKSGEQAETADDKSRRSGDKR